MSIKTIIIIILSLYGLGSSLAFIIYLVKYSNLKSKYKQSINNKGYNNCNNNLNEDFNKELNEESNKDLNNKELNEESNKELINITNYSEDQLKNELKKIDDIKYSKLIQTYDIYNDADFYNKFDIYDDYNDKIIIYSKDLKDCYLKCEELEKCYAFSKYHNYCYLKGTYNLNDKINISKVSLFVKNINLITNNNTSLNNTSLNNTIQIP
jgi:hypothetical protein